MDVAETVAQLKAAQETAKALSDAASQQQALPLKANAAQERFVKAIDPQQEGKFTGSVGGQEAKKAQAGRRELGEPTERFAQPFILSEAPGDIGLASPASTLLFAGANLHATVQQDLHIASAHTVSTAAGHGASWFSHSGGIKSIAQAGTQTIQANTDQMEILADQSITITSSNDEDPHPGQGEDRAPGRPVLRHPRRRQHHLRLPGEVLGQGEWECVYGAGE
jgi:type VI secretion system secreted protein VgrG